MRVFRLNKLVRDGVYDNMVQLGQCAALRELTNEQYLQELANKLREEAGEFDSADPEKGLKELGDLQQVIDELAAALGGDPKKVRVLQEKRFAAMGGFAGRRYITTLELNDDDPWVDYYAKEPERFPEVNAKP